jgi:segregation and condensation protein A
LKVLYRLDAFEGPLDLLLHLIDREEIDIYDIPIRRITEQYMEYVQAMQELELEVASEFLVMAATLLAIKSKMLLPKPPAPEPDEYGDIAEEAYDDPRAELVQRLVEYRKYKELAGLLREKELARGLIHTREPDDLTPYLQNVRINPLEGVKPEDLLAAFQKVLRKMASRQAVAKIRRDEISVKDRMRDLVEIFRARRGPVLFSKLFDAGMTRVEIVVTFLALLELMKRNRIVCYQHGPFADIVIHAREGEPPDELSADEIDY